MLLPVDPDGSAAKLRDELRERTGRDVGVIITDSFGRPWRQGTTDVAIGAAGIEVMQELTGEHDPIGLRAQGDVHHDRGRDRGRGAARRPASSGACR